MTANNNVQSMFCVLFTLKNLNSKLVYVLKSTDCTFDRCPMGLDK